MPKITDEEAKKAKTFVQACPNCGSTKFHQENDNKAIFGDSGFYVCDSCAFTAKVFPEVDVDRYADFVKGTKKKRFSRKVSSKVSGPLSVLKAVLVVTMIVALALTFGLVIAAFAFLGWIGYAMARLLRKVS